MRLKLPAHPRGGQERFRKYFLWSPVTIGRERRWLETATIFEYYTDDYPWGYWKKVRFIDTPLEITVDWGDGTKDKFKI